MSSIMPSQNGAPSSYWPSLQSMQQQMARFIPCFNRPISPYTFAAGAVAVLTIGGIIAAVAYCRLRGPKDGSAPKEGAGKQPEGGIEPTTTTTTIEVVSEGVALEIKKADEKALKNAEKAIWEHREGRLEKLQRISKNQTEKLQQYSEKKTNFLKDGDTLSAKDVEMKLTRLQKKNNELVNELLPECEESLGVYASLEECPPSIGSAPSASLSITSSVEGMQGPRPTMEDAHFLLDGEEKGVKGFVAGVFDGHRGKAVAEYARDVFQKDFFNVLKEFKGNVPKTLQVLCDRLHEAVVTKGLLDGSTAVVSFINEEKGAIYTATLGDCRANIYRVVNENELKSIPLSCVRDWTYPKEAERAAKSQGNRVKKWPDREANPKGLRLSPGIGKDGLNVSRALGDKEYALVKAEVGKDQVEGIIHKAKVTVRELKSGDIVVLSCDGLPDYLSESKIIEKLKTLNFSENPAQELVNYTIEEMKAKMEKVKDSGGRDTGDNVTAIVMKVS